MLPPFVGVAVKVTFVPAQIAPEGTAVMLTSAVTDELIVTAIALEVAGLPLTQVALLVITQVIASLLFNATSVYVV